MYRLSVDLQDGFTGESLELELDGLAPIPCQPVTRHQIGLALSLVLEVPGVPRYLRVRDLASGQVAEVPLPVQQPLHLGIQRSPDAGFTFVCSGDPFLYL